MGLSRQSLSNSNLAELQPLTSESAVVEEAHVPSYSHGFEKIYALENIDIRSVRKIDLASGSKSEISVEPSLEAITEKTDPQLHFNFLSKSLDHLEPFILREPIQVLGLSKRIEVFLISQGKKIIKDLLNDDKRSIAEIKGLGLGHLDEVQTKLENALKGHCVDKVERIDFISWLRSLVADIDPKKAHVALEFFNLSDLVPISTIEAVEVRRLTVTSRKEWLKDALELFRAEDKCLQVHEDMHKIVLQFIAPWMDKRLGIATEAELTERLLSMSQSAERSADIFAWLKEVYFEKTFPLASYLCKVDDRLYSNSLAVDKAVRKVVDKARSYFYKGEITYPLPMLSNLISRECARDWLGFREGFVEKVLRLSTRFRVRKGHSGSLIVKLS